MPTFSNKSKDHLQTVHPDLRRLFQRVILDVDCTILEGKRTGERQRQLFADGKSKTLNSKHLTGQAIDVMCYPVDWTDWNRNYAFCGYVRGIARALNIQVRGGFDWDDDFTFRDQKFVDLPHWELVD